MFYVTNQSSAIAGNKVKLVYSGNEGQVQVYLFEEAPSSILTLSEVTTYAEKVAVIETGDAEQQGFKYCTVSNVLNGTKVSVGYYALYDGTSFATNVQTMNNYVQVSTSGRIDMADPSVQAESYNRINANEVFVDAISQKGSSNIKNVPLPSGANVTVIALSTSSELTDTKIAKQLKYNVDGGTDDVTGFQILAKGDVKSLQGYTPNLIGSMRITYAGQS